MTEKKITDIKYLVPGEKLQGEGIVLKKKERKLPEDHIEIIRSASEKAGNCHIKCGSSCPLPRICRKFLANLPVVFQI